MATKSGASWVPAAIMQTVGGGAESEPGEQASNESLIQKYWEQILPQLGYTGPIKEVATTRDEYGRPETGETGRLNPQALAAIEEFRRQGYDIVRNPERTQTGKNNVTEYGLRLPSGELANTWEYEAGAWYKQAAPYINLVLPAVLGIAGTQLGVAGTAAGGAVTVPDVIKSIGANITGQTANALLNNVVGGAVVGGAKELITSGGDAEAAIKGALSAGALAGVSELAQPYIEKAANALSNLTSEEVAQLAETADATAAAGDVAGNLGQVDVGGAPNLFDVQRQAYESAIAAGLSQQEAINFAFQEGQMLSAPGTSGELSGFSPAANANALAGNTAGTAGAAGNLGQVNVGGADIGYNPYAGLAENFPAAGYVDPLAGGAGFDYAGVAEQSTARYLPTQQGDTMSTPTAVTPTGQVATVDLTGGQVAPVIPETDAGLGTAALGAGAAGAAGAGIAGGGLTVPPGAGLGDAAGPITTPGGLDANVAGGSGITAGTTGGAGLDTSGLALGGTLGAGAAAGSALSPAAGVAAMPGATGLTGIKAVDDFLSYLGTPAGAMALSAFGGLAGGYFQGQGAEKAAQIQANAAEKALTLQQDMFDYQKSLLAPYQEVGVNALRRLEGVMGLGGQPATGGQQLLEMDPGYAFRLGEGMKALERLQASRGNMLSGGAIKAGQRYAQDVASQEYGSAYNRLANIAGLGQTAGTQLGTAGQQFGSAAGETLAQQANALAAGRVGRVSAYTQGVNTAANAFGNYANQQQQNQLFRDIYGRAFGG